MPEWKLSNTHIFFIRYIAAFLGTLDSASNLHLGNHFKQQSLSTKGIKMWKEKKNTSNVTLNISQKGHLLTIGKMKF